MKKALKVTLIVIAVIVALFIGLVSYFVYDQLKMESKLDAIITNLANEETIDMTLETTGDCAKIEKIMKTSYRDFYKLVDKIINEYGNPVVTNSLSANNYAKDGPEFVNTRKELNELKIKRQELNEQMLQIVSQEAIDNNIKRYKLDDYYSEIYEEYAHSLKLIIEDVVEEDKSFNESIDVVIEILDFLQQEKDHWQVEGENILFDDQSLLDKYNWLISKICLDCDTSEDTDSPSSL